jgi:hypothetical protein
MPLACVRIIAGGPAGIAPGEAVAALLIFLKSFSWLVTKAALVLLALPVTDIGGVRLRAARRHPVRDPSPKQVPAAHESRPHRKGLGPT